MSLWIIEVSKDGGVTWKIEQPYRLFKSEDRAHRRLAKCASWNRLYRLSEFERVRP